MRLKLLVFLYLSHLLFWLGKMSEKNFSELLNATFDHGTVHFKHLEQFLKSLLVKLNLSNISDDERYTSKNDPMMKAIPSTNTFKQGLCRDESNPFESMLNIVNLIKRVEALEISVQKLTSLIQTIIIEQRKREEDSIESEDDYVNRNDINSTVSEVQMSKEQHDTDAKKPNQTEVGSSKEFKGLKNELKKCCEKNLNSSSFETFGFVEGELLKELPCTQSFSKCPFHRLEKSCKKKLSDIEPDNKYANLCDLRELERHLKEQNDSVFSLINSNHFYLHQQICQIQQQMGKIEGQIDDIFFACEQNDEKIDETISSLSEFNAKIFCLKADVRGLLDDSSEFKKKITDLNEKYETMNNVKANKSDDQLKLNLNIMFGELEKMVKVKYYEEFVDVVHMRMSMNEETLKKFQESVKKSLICFKAFLDEKLDKDELKKFKSIVGTLFDDFVKDLKILIFNINQNAVSMGASKCLQTNLNCLVCDSKVSMTTEFPQLENSSRLFKNKLFRGKTPKKRSKAGIYCAGMKNFLKPIEKKKKIPSCHQSLLQFPPRTQQCFIISNYRSIFKADPLKCLVDSKI